MPYASIDDLPQSVRAHLPTHAQGTYAPAVKSAWYEDVDRAPADREATAHRVAWAAVKHRYQKEGDRWTLR